MYDTLYYINACPGARAVRLYCLIKNIEIKEVLIDFKKGDHMTPEFLKLNPMHTVPTIKMENGMGLSESRMILKHMAGDSVNNMEIDKWLFWDLGFLNTNVGKVIYPRLFMNSEPIQKDIDRLVEKLEYLNSYLENKKFLVNEELTIADLSSCMLIYNSQVRSDLVNIENYSNIVSWMNNIEAEFKPEDWSKVMHPFLEWRKGL